MVADGISGNYSYRDQWTNPLQNGTVQGSEESGSTGQVWNAVFTDKKDNGVTADDFLTLMVAQLQNQDFMNPVDDTQYVTQLAQFATMQQMQEMASYMKTNYVMSLAGKNVTAAKLSISGELQKETGLVEKISLVNNEYAVYVNGKQFSLEQIMEIHGSASADSETGKLDPSKMEYLLSLTGREITVRQRDENGDPTGKQTGIVQRVSAEEGNYRLCINGEWYPLDDVIDVGDYVGQDNKVPDVEEPSEGSGDNSNTENPDVGSQINPPVEGDTSTEVPADVLMENLGEDAGDKTSTASDDQLSR